MLAFVPPEFLLGLANALDPLCLGLLIIDGNGQPCFATPHVQPVARGEGEYGAARAWVQELAAHARRERLPPGGAPPREARFAGTLYEGAAAAFHDGAIVVLCRRTTEGVSDEALLAAFGLTPSEAAVARLLALRRSNAEVARTLGISPHTARRHTERVLGKMGLTSRNEVEHALRALGYARTPSP